MSFMIMFRTENLEGLISMKRKEPMHKDIICPKCNKNEFISYYDSTKNKDRYECKCCGYKTVNPKFIELGKMIIDKKESQFDWKEWTTHLQKTQELKHKASDEQDYGNAIIKTNKDYIIFQPIGDMHIGSAGMNLELFKSYTKDMIEIDNLYSALLGDDLDLFCSFKNFLATQNMMMNPDEQTKFLESWLDDVKHKMIFAGYGNHAEMEERLTALNTTRKILGRYLIYHNGIGRMRLHINDIEYRICSTHKTRYNSSINQTHGLKQLARNDLPNEDIYLGADKHNPAVEIFPLHGKSKVFVQVSTLKANDGFGKRYFSYWHYADSPCLILGAKEKSITVCKNLNDAKNILGLGK